MRGTTGASTRANLRGHTLKITCEAIAELVYLRGDISCLHTPIPRNHMTTTVLELLEHLKHYPGATLLNIKDVDDTEFAIVDYQSVNNTLEIIIVEK